MRRWLLPVLLCPLGLPVALGEGPAPSEARRQFAVGLSEARGGHWESARAAFQTAYALAPEPAVLFNLAGAQSRTGNLLVSSANYRRIVESKDPRLGPSHRRAAERQIARIERRIPRLRVVIDGLRADDRLLLDKTRLYPNELDLELWLDPGPHTFAVHRADGSEEIRSIVLVEEEHRLMQFRVSP